jgi:thiol-disulfide isomerase/thioredoxin
MQRRHVLTGGVALAACAAGAGMAWWRLAPREAASPAVAAFWASQFEGPHGETVAMSAFRGRPLLVNFWATWCPPCVEELPLLNAFQAQHGERGWQVLGLAVDQVAPVRQFLQKLPLNFPVGMAGLAGTELSRGLGNLGGGLPFSLVFDRAGAVQHQKVGKLSAQDLVQWAQLA